MAADDQIRVALQAQRAGHQRLREVMLTMAIGASGPGDSWAERCRARLLAERPNHFLGSQPTLDRALSDPKIRRALQKLEDQYPPTRVQWIKLRLEVTEGPFTGKVEPLGKVLDELIGAPAPAEAEVRRDAPESVRGPLVRARSGARLAYARSLWGDTDGYDATEPPSDETPTGSTTDESVSTFYLTVLVAIAMLLATVGQGRDRHAA